MSRQILEEDFESSLDEVESFVVESLHLGFELLVFFRDSVEVGWFGCLTIDQLPDKLINLGDLIWIEIELLISLIRILA